PVRLERPVLPPFAGGVALGPEAPRVGLAHDGAVVTGERRPVGLLDRAASERRRFLFEVEQYALAHDPLPLADAEAPAEVRPAVHRMDARQAPDVAGDDAIHGEEDRRRRDPRVGPEQIAIADAVRPVTDGVAGR